uniref:Uncharacterized protein n=1 Tax=Denticeps clupeoides TaxID=299321 RepID=A0AAY4ADK6_9TELE
MRVVSAVIFLCMCVLLFLVYQAVVQELGIHSANLRFAEAKENVKRKEDEIVSIKMKIQDLNGDLMPLNKQHEEISKKVEEVKQATEDAKKSLETCNKQKEDSTKKKSEVFEVIKKMKESQEAEQKKFQDEIQGLKQQILERDKKLCTFLDPQYEEGKKLCDATNA